MGMFFKETNVFEEALNRIRLVYDHHDEVSVSMSGGKDSTVLFNLALIVAKEKNRLPLKVFWLDQEAEWQHTVDYMNWIMRLPEVEPVLYQIPFDFTNSLSPQSNFVRIWDETQKDKWVHPQSDISIKENPSPFNRFHDLVKNLPEYYQNGENGAVLVGMRIMESMARRMTIGYSSATFMGETWAQKKTGKVQTFWPIYDFTDNDIWTAIAKNHWRYNEVYDLMYRWGVPKTRMRVSALIHETAWHSLEMLHEFEPKTYDRFVARVPGVSTFDHIFDEGGVVPRELPFAFKDWKEYRDYLLVHIVKPEYWDLFRNRWKKQTGEDWYRVHVKEVILNDIDGTNNSNSSNRFRKRDKTGQNGGGVNQFELRDKLDFAKWQEEKQNGN